MTRALLALVFSLTPVLPVYADKMEPLKIPGGPSEKDMTCEEVIKLKLIPAADTMPGDGVSGTVESLIQDINESIRRKKAACAFIGESKKERQPAAAPTQAPEKQELRNKYRKGYY